MNCLLVILRVMAPKPGCIASSIYTDESIGSKESLTKPYTLI